jgi:hypothetical protein
VVGVTDVPVPFRRAASRHCQKKQKANIVQTFAAVDFSRGSGVTIHRLFNKINEIAADRRKGATRLYFRL